jgi:hypothetical protein
MLDRRYREHHIESLHQPPHAYPNILYQRTGRLLDCMSARHAEATSLYDAEATSTPLSRTLSSTLSGTPSAARRLPYYSITS